MDEFAHYLAYERIHPYGDERAEYMIAQLTAALASIYTKKGKPSPKPSDFMLSEQILKADPEYQQKQMKEAHRRHNEMVKAGLIE